jgi:uncharacterized protein YcaQ
MLDSVRTSSLLDALIEEGALREVIVEGSRRPYLALPDTKVSRVRDDGRMRILAPLDPLLWDRKLVRQIFDFDYVWEVYKPKSERRWGWYVCPLLHGGELVGRIEAHVNEKKLLVDRIWRERAFDDDALSAALERHANACGVDLGRVTRGTRRRRRS